jgi:hypothetical protein
MEPRRTLPVKPVRPDPATLDPQKIVIDYDVIADTLYIHLFGEGHRARVLQIGGDFDLRLDPASHLIVGYQIPGLLTAVVQRHPELLDLAGFSEVAPTDLPALAAIPAREVAALHRRVASEQRRRQAAAVLDDLVEPRLAASA